MVDHYILQRVLDKIGIRGKVIKNVALAVSPVCDVLGVLEKEANLCAELLFQEQNRSENQWLTSGQCAGMWDNVSCWPSSAVGQTVSIQCPEFLQAFTGNRGFVYRNCTHKGWSDVFPTVAVACGYDVNDTSNEARNFYYVKLKNLYTVGYGTSLGTLMVALVILATFRRLHCTRNYIHMHLFASFILRAVSIFVRDGVLYSAEDIDHCSSSLAGCKFVMILIQYCIMANYSWLLVEGLYLHTLLTISLISDQKYFGWYIALGWGSPLMFIVAWSICRHLYEDKGCWDINMNASVWWIIRGPVIISIFINFIFFIRILRMLIKKLRSSEVWGKQFSHCKRLAKSTLLLIPLFGIHYIVFAFFPEDVSNSTLEIRLSFELTLGSFQGFVVAVLYCFLNGEVQCEIQRKWGPWRLRKQIWFHQQKSSTSNSGESVLTQVLQVTKSSPKEQRKMTAQKSSFL
ncbi:secretin receptor [Microcaecilia unicolor]|uniref:Secretin receptor n=1 Tax=Microcaecilia unicolor TaxID=1415580 RepID=A0A6P7YNY5_9AMPH|nr:secretin receptor [Microcaecilia unicolor]